MIKSDLLGWTLAEIALALLFALLAAFAPSYRNVAMRNKGLEEEIKNAASLAAENDRLRAENLALQSELAALRLENAELRSMSVAPRSDLKSIVLPSCAELNKNSDWLFTATVIAEDSFEINGRALTLAGIRKEFAEQLADAKKQGCVQRIHVSFEEGMSAQVYDSALKGLRRWFYPTSLGQR